jgi:hypothetical protein
MVYHNEKLLNHLKGKCSGNFIFDYPACNILNGICTSGSHLVMRKKMVQIVLTGESEISSDCKISTSLGQLH